MRPYVLFCAVALWLGLCPAFGQTPGSGDKSGVPPTDSSSTNILVRANEKYVLVVGDLIEIKVYQEDDLNTRARIDKDKTVSLPLLGSIELGGLTVAEATTKVRDLLEADYLYNPQVVLGVVEYTAKKFSVLGQVMRPGYYEMPANSKINLLQALSMAGGFNRIARESDVTVKRVVDGKEVVLKLDAKKMAVGKVPMFDIQPEDSITVPETRF